MITIASRRVSLVAIGDVLMAAVFTAAAELDVWVRGTVSGPHVTNAVILAFVGPPLAVRRRWPSLAVTVTATAIALQAVVVGKPPSGFLYWPILIGAYSLGAHAPTSKRALAALVWLSGAYGVVIAYSLSHGSFNVTVVPWSFASLVPWMLGRWLRGRRARIAALAASEQLHRENEQRRLYALEQERGRMARELHDILAHSVSLMGVQAGAAEQVLSRDPERARPVLQSIQQTSRDSVVELRRLLVMLREEELEPDRAPQPRLDQLDALIAGMRAAGMPVELQVDGAAHPLAPGIELTAYRVVQEALTNALKHAQPSRVAVVVRYATERLSVSVENDGVRTTRNGDGHGLIGMRERISIYDGQLEIDARTEGSFRVEATIPLQAPA
jgi:signal transduction histidine kinase